MDTLLNQVQLYLHLDPAKVQSTDRRQQHVANLTNLVNQLEQMHQGHDREVNKTALKRSRWEDLSDDDQDKPRNKKNKKTKKTKKRLPHDAVPQEQHTNNPAPNDPPQPGPNNVPTAHDESRHIPLIHGCRSVFSYDKLRKIDEGTYGVVFEAKDKESGDIVALKQVKLNVNASAEGFPITALRETNVLLALRHDNIVRVREMVTEQLTSKDDLAVYMVMDFWPIDLKDVLQNVGRFSLAQTKCMMQQLLRAAAHFHDRWFLHRDLKTSNVLYRDGRICVADFGLARKFDHPLRKYTQLVVTLVYRAPELLLGTDIYSTAVDNWSLGCIMGELLVGKYLLPARSEDEQIRKIWEYVGSPTPRNWPGHESLPLWTRYKPSLAFQGKLKDMFSKNVIAEAPFLDSQGLDLLKGLLTLDPVKRLSAADALEHQWFTTAPLPSAPADMPVPSR